MLSFAADENLDFDIVRGLRRRLPGIDIVTVQEAGLRGNVDPDVLAWAAATGRVLLSHDVSTLIAFAYDRVRGGLRMPGLFEVGQGVSVGQAIDDLALIAECSLEGEWEGQVRFLPL